MLSAYLYLAGKYEKLYAMGTSVGAASILIALPEMPKLAGVIAENPMVSSSAIRDVDHADYEKRLAAFLNSVQ